MGKFEAHCSHKAAEARWCRQGLSARCMMPCVQVVPQRLAGERRAQAAHVARVRGALERGKGAWFLQGAPVAELMQHCVLPRLLLSPGDAQYAARLLLLAHELGAPHLSTLLCLDHVRAPTRRASSCCLWGAAQARCRA